MTPDPTTDPTTVLDPLPVDDTVKADAWDAFHSAAGPSHFKSLMDPLGLPDEAKADLWDMKFGSSEPTQAKEPMPAEEPQKPNQVQRVSPLTPNPPTAALATAPEKPATLAIQLNQLSGGARRVVMFPKGQGQPTSLPNGTAITHDAFGNTYAYRPDLIKKSEIHTAAKNNTLPQILGGPMGMGAPDKTALQPQQAAVVARASDGTEAQSTATDPVNLPSAIQATRTLVPPGGSLSVEPPSRVVSQRGMLADGATPSSAPEPAEFFRGAWDIPLNDKGRSDADKVARDTAGQFTEIHASPLGRAQETAGRVAAANPHAGPINTTTALEPIFLGAHEGERVTPDRIADLSDHIINRPDEPLTGVGKFSGQPGESVNDWKNPLILHAIKQIESFQPGQKILNVTHYRDIRGIQSWLKAGGGYDLAIDPHELARKGDEKPGQLFRLDPFTHEFSESPDAVRDGIYWLRHGETAANDTNSEVPQEVKGQSLIQMVRIAPLSQALRAFSVAPSDSKTAVAGILRKRLARSNQAAWDANTRMLAERHFGMRPPVPDLGPPQPIQ